MSILTQTADKTSTVTVTLARAHKINERINGKLNELRTTAAAKSQAVSVQSHSGPEQVDLIKRNAKQALDVVPTYLALVAAQAALRTAVAKANAANGISEVLTVIEKNKRLLTLCDTLVAAMPDANTLSAEALAGRPVGEKAGEYGSAYAVSGLTAGELQPYADAKTAVERENFALQDQLADLNANKVSFPVADSVLEMLSLKAA